MLTNAMNSIGSTTRDSVTGRVPGMMTPVARSSSSAPRGSDGPVTLSRVARAAGCSISAVSTVLNNRDNGIRISVKMRQRILEAARELRYIPNAAARAQQSRRFNTVALVSRVQIAPMHMRVVLGASKVLNDHDMHLLVTMLQGAVNPTTALPPRLFRELSVDGMLVHHAFDISDDLVEQIHDQPMPVVWINAKEAEDCTHPDDVAAARDATRLLIEHGHRRIAGVFADPANRKHYSYVDRIAGYEDAMRQAGLSPMVRVCSRDAYAGGERLSLFRSMLRANDRPTAILAMADGFHISVLLAAAQEGLSLPGDLSLIALSDVMTTLDGGMPISTLHVPLEACASEAATMLLRRIENPSLHQPPVVVPAPPIALHTVSRPKD